jgi:hypothetical protein
VELANQSSVPVHLDKIGLLQSTARSKTRLTVGPLASLTLTFILTESGNAPRGVNVTAQNLIQQLDLQDSGL